MSYDEADDSNQKTSTFSVATLLELVARSGDDSGSDDAWPSEAPTTPAVANDQLPPPDESGVELLKRATPVLVFPEPPAVAAPEPARQVPAPPRAPEPRRAPEPPRAAPVRPLATTVVSRRRREERARAHVRKSVRLRLFCLAVLAGVVSSQPWWWNIGDLRANATQRAVKAHAVKNGTPPSR